jgi:hypothetical protein
VLSDLPKTPKPQNPKTPKPQNPKTPKPQNPIMRIKGRFMDQINYKPD